MKKTVNQNGEADWEEFRLAGLLWWVNRGLHLFGWAIVLSYDEDGSVIRAYPIRVDYTGFDREDEETGFKRLRKHMKEKR